MPDVDHLKVPFPTKAELLARDGIQKRVVDELYDLWVVAHEEAMRLIVRLPEVFGNPKRPRITLRVARGYDDDWFLSEERVAELSALDPEEHWMDVTLESTIKYQEYFCFSDDEGWLFYFPAFIRHYLAEFPLSGYDAIIFACENRFHFSLFTPDQVAFVEEFVALCKMWE